MLRILVLAGILFTKNIFARVHSEADSLRLLGKFKEELLVREKGPKGFDLDLARANAFILQGRLAEAGRILDRITTHNSEQDFWKAKSVAMAFREKGEPGKAIEILTAAPVKKQSFSMALRDLALGQNYAVLGDHLSAIRYFEEALANFEVSGYPHHYMAGLTLSDLAFAYDEAGLRNKTIALGDRALKLFVAHYPKDFGIISTTHNNLLFYVIDYGDEKVATEIHRNYTAYMNRFLADKRSFGPVKDHADVHAEALYRLSNLRFYGFKKDGEKVKTQLDLLEDFFRKAPAGWVENNKGILSAGYEVVQYSFRKEGRLPQAIQYAAMVDKAEKLPYNKMKKYAAFALIHYDAGNHTEALKNVDLCLKVFDFPAGSRSLQTLMVLKAELLSHLGKTKEARKTLEEIYRDVLGENTDIRKVDITKYPEHVNNIFLNLLIHSAWTYQGIYRHTGKTEDHQMTGHFFQLAARLFEKYYRKGIYNNSLGTLLDQIEDGLFHSPLPFSNEEIINNLNRAEAISNAHLWSRFSSKYLQNLKLPKETIARKNSLQLERNLLTRTYESELKHQKEVREIDAELAGIEKKLAGISKEYALMSSSGFDIRAVQSLLKPGEVIVKYTVGEKRVYGHVISREKIALKTLGEAGPLKEDTGLYLANLRSIRQSPPALQHSLQNALIAPLEITACKSVIFISEGFLSYLPFEILLRSSKPVSYAFSFRNLLINQSLSPRVSGNLAGFVPVYRESDSPPENRVAELLYSVSELKNIREQIGETTLFEGTEANKKAFLKSLGQFKVHHLAMHSEMDEEDYEQSSLLFANSEKLYFHELYALNFPSEMVVLSACNTGLGKYLNGEGMMSLARALTYAGVRSSVASLWQVPDKESAELMTLFYEYLSKGRPKDEALMLAKRSFVEKYPMKTHPYYWAGFILTGDTAPLRMSRFNLHHFLIPGGIIAAVLAFYLRRRNASRRIT